ncbi:MAG: hypothetical protein JO297_18500 [Nitrososphaeraceae archaeon]|nr:hypothetical protein [Nitrososphaeraceae archaeon]
MARYLASSYWPNIIFYITLLVTPRLLYCDDSDAFFRRKVIISFPNRFEGKKDDPDLVKNKNSRKEL